MVTMHEKLTGPHTSVKLDFREAKVCKLDVTFIGYEHIVRLQVPGKLEFQ